MWKILFILKIIITICESFEYESVEFYLNEIKNLEKQKNLTINFDNYNYNYNSDNENNFSKLFINLINNNTHMKI